MNSTDLSSSDQEGSGQISEIDHTVMQTPNDWATEKAGKEADRAY